MFAVYEINHFLYCQAHLVELLLFSTQSDLSTKSFGCLPMVSQGKLIIVHILFRSR